jgi:LysM repeat protein
MPAFSDDQFAARRRRRRQRVGQPTVDPIVSAQQDAILRFWERFKKAHKLPEDLPLGTFQGNPITDPIQIVQRHYSQLADQAVADRRQKRLDKQRRRRGGDGDPRAHYGYGEFLSAAADETAESDDYGDDGEEASVDAEAEDEIQTIDDYVRAKGVMPPRPGQRLAPQPGLIIHTVGPKETVSVIAADYGVTVDDVIVANKGRLPADGGLYAGQEIYVPDVEFAQAPDGAEESPPVRYEPPEHIMVDPHRGGWGDLLSQPAPLEMADTDPRRRRTAPVGSVDMLPTPYIDSADSDGEAAEAVVEDADESVQPPPLGGRRNTNNANLDVHSLGNISADPHRGAGRTSLLSDAAEDAEAEEGAADADDGAAVEDGSADAGGGVTPDEQATAGESADTAIGETPQQRRRRQQIEQKYARRLRARRGYGYGKSGDILGEDVKNARGKDPSDPAVTKVINKAARITADDMDFDPDDADHRAIRQRTSKELGRLRNELKAAVRTNDVDAAGRAVARIRRLVAGTNAYLAETGKRNTVQVERRRQQLNTHLHTIQERMDNVQARWVDAQDAGDDREVQRLDAQLEMLQKGAQRTLAERDALHVGRTMTRLERRELGEGYRVSDEVADKLSWRRQPTPKPVEPAAGDSADAPLLEPATGTIDKAVADADAATDVDAQTDTLPVPAADQTGSTASLASDSDAAIAAAETADTDQLQPLGGRPNRHNADLDSASVDKAVEAHKAATADTDESHAHLGYALEVRDVASLYDDAEAAKSAPRKTKKDQASDYVNGFDLTSFQGSEHLKDSVWQEVAWIKKKVASGELTPIEGADRLLEIEKTVSAISKHLSDGAAGSSALSPRIAASSSADQTDDHALGPNVDANAEDVLLKPVTQAAMEQAHRAAKAKGLSGEALVSYQTRLLRDMGYDPYRKALTKEAENRAQFKAQREEGLTGAALEERKAELLGQWGYDPYAREPEDKGPRSTLDRGAIKEIDGNAYLADSLMSGGVAVLGDRGASIDPYTPEGQRVLGLIEKAQKLETSYEQAIANADPAERGRLRNRYEIARQAVREDVVKAIGQLGNVEQIHSTFARRVDFTNWYNGVQMGQDVPDSPKDDPSGFDWQSAYEGMKGRLEEGQTPEQVADWFDGLNAPKQAQKAFAGLLAKKTGRDIIGFKAMTTDYARFFLAQTGGDIALANKLAEKWRVRSKGETGDVIQLVHDSVSQETWTQAKALRAGQTGLAASGNADAVFAQVLFAQLARVRELVAKGNWGEIRAAKGKDPLEAGILANACLQGLELAARRLTMRDEQYAIYEKLDSAGHVGTPTTIYDIDAIKRAVAMEIGDAIREKRKTNNFAKSPRMAKLLKEGRLTMTEEGLRATYQEWMTYWQNHFDAVKAAVKTADDSPPPRLKLLKMEYEDIRMAIGLLPLFMTPQDDRGVGKNVATSLLRGLETMGGNIVRTDAWSDDYAARTWSSGDPAETRETLDKWDAIMGLQRAEYESDPVQSRAGGVGGWIENAAYGLVEKSPVIIASLKNPAILFTDTFPDTYQSMREADIPVEYAEPMAVTVGLLAVALDRFGKQKGMGKGLLTKLQPMIRKSFVASTKQFIIDRGTEITRETLEDFLLELAKTGVRGVASQLSDDIDFDIDAEARILAEELKQSLGENALLSLFGSAVSSSPPSNMPHPSQPRRGVGGRTARRAGQVGVAVGETLGDAIRATPDRLPSHEDDSR